MTSPAKAAFDVELSEVLMDFARATCRSDDGDDDDEDDRSSETPISARVVKKVRKGNMAKTRAPDKCGNTKYLKDFRQDRLMRKFLN